MGVLPWANQLVKVPRGREDQIVWPQGTTFINCKRARTGHLMLPIGNFKKLKENHENQTLLSFTANSIFERQKELAQRGLNPNADGSVGSGTVNYQ